MNIDNDERIEACWGCKFFSPDDYPHGYSDYHDDYPSCDLTKEDKQYKTACATAMKKLKREKAMEEAYYSERDKEISKEIEKELGGVTLSEIEYDRVFKEKIMARRCIIDLIKEEIKCTKK